MEFEKTKKEFVEKKKDLDERRIKRRGEMSSILTNNSQL